MDERLAETFERVWQETWGSWRSDWPGLVRAALAAPFRRQTYLNIAYLLFSLPLGTMYVAVLLFGLIVGLATLPILVGFPVLLVVIAAASWANNFERELARIWLGVEIPPPIPTMRRASGLKDRVLTYLRDQVTWTNLLYLGLKFPLGALTFWVTFQAISTAARLLVRPINRDGDLGIVRHVWALLGPGNVGHFLDVLIPGGDINPGELVFIRQMLVGGLVAFVAIHLLNVLALLSGRFARIMLGPSEAALRVAVSEAEATQARRSAERAEQSRRELMVNVSHELRTPVASIRGHVESLLMAVDEADEHGAESLPNDQLHSYLGIIYRETERLGALVDDLLALTRSEAGELRLVVRPTDATDIVNEVHETLAPLAWRDRSVTLIAECDPDLPLVLADRDRLAQVLLNLVRNAITHTPAGGIVSITLSEELADEDGQVWAVLAVADTGDGIPPDEVDKIFERFYRVDASRNRASGGFGLGLAIVKDLVTAMHGTIHVESRVGEGSRFSVRLPFAEPLTNPARSAKQHAVVGTP
jgi:signal transduction histidine kinase